LFPAIAAELPFFASQDNVGKVRIHLYCFDLEQQSFKSVGGFSKTVLGGSTASISPNGSRVMFLSDDGHVVITTMDGQEVARMDSMSVQTTDGLINPVWVDNETICMPVEPRTSGRTFDLQLVQLDQEGQSRARIWTRDWNEDFARAFLNPQSGGTVKTGPAEGPSARPTAPEASTSQSPSTRP